MTQSLFSVADLTYTPSKHVSTFAEEFCNHAKRFCKFTIVFCNIAKLFCISENSFCKLDLLNLTSKFVHVSLRKARTGLSHAKLIVPHDFCMWEKLMQCCKDLLQRFALSRRSVVLIFVERALRGVSTLVADANAERIMPLHMASTQLQWSRVVASAVPTDVDMVAGILTEPSLLVTPHQCFDRKVLIRSRVRAVKDQIINHPSQSSGFRTQQAR